MYVIKPSYLQCIHCVKKVLFIKGWSQLKEVSFYQIQRPFSKLMGGGGRNHLQQFPLLATFFVRGSRTCAHHDAPKCSMHETVFFLKSCSRNLRLSVGVLECFRRTIFHEGNCFFIWKSCSRNSSVWVFVCDAQVIENTLRLIRFCKRAEERKITSYCGVVPK